MVDNDLNIGLTSISINCWDCNRGSKSVDCTLILFNWSHVIY